MISMCACCGLYGERIEYCGPLVRAGTQYNATTCPARAGLIPRPAPTHWGRGTISACAERSRRPVEQVRVERDHLRVCGAVSDSVNREHDLMGSSPRVRSGPKPETKGSACLGIISACAERSSSYPISRAVCGDHLRVCGAVMQRQTQLYSRLGSSPRVRSGQLYFIGIWSGWMVRNV